MNERVMCEYGKFAVPLSVNGYDVVALRDSGCQLEALIHPSLVRDLSKTPEYTGEYMQCRGAFDQSSVKHPVPVANIKIISPTLGCPEPMMVRAGVWNVTRQLYSWQ